MRCPVCKHDNAPGAKFCSECGTRLELRCPVCTTPHEAGAKFCSECGTNLQESAPSSLPDDLSRYVPDELLRKIRAAQSGESMRGERRTVTMLFADIEGSTAAAEHLDPEEWAEIVNGAFGHLIEPVYRYEGTLARLQGDAILAFFGAPIAHEDDPVRAVRAGLDIQNDIRAYTAEVATRHGVDIGVRVGINTGLVVVGEVGSDLRVEYTALGDAINVAARMEQTAEPGTVRVTDETLELLGGMFDAEPIGPVEVKGKSDPVLAHRIIGVTRRDDALFTPETTPLLGRDDELAALRGVVARLDDGLGAVCTVIGEAGIGKSRLLAAMYDDIVEPMTVARSWSAEGRASWLRGRARSYERNVPHATFRDVLCDWWDRSSGDDCFGLVLGAVDGALGQSDEDVAGFLAHMIGAPLPDAQGRLVESLPAPALHERMTGAVVTYLRAEAKRRPIVMVLDDLHWADAMTLALIEQLMDLSEEVPLALVLVMRPNREDTAWRIVEVAARDHAHMHTAIELESLPADATQHLLDTLLGDDAIDPGMRRHILERSNGNPLFVEEIVRSLGESRGGQVDVPPSLMGLLTARLDRLEEEARVVAQVASVIGREFESETLAAVVDVPGDNDASIRELLRRGILEERRRVPTPSFSFRHPLIREAAYSTVLLRTRRDLHGRIARHLAQRTPEAVEEIARHYVEAAEPMVAFPFLLEAGRRAIRAMALSDAISHFTIALDSPPDDAPADEILAAHDGLGEAYSLVPDLTRASAAFQSLLKYGRASGKPDIEVTALNRLGFSTAALSGDVDGAMIYLQQARDLAESIGDETGLAEYHMNACFITVMTGDLEQAVEHDSETARIGELVGNPKVRLLGLVRKAGNLASILRFDEALEAYQEGLEVAEELGNEELVAVLKCNTLGVIDVVRGELARAVELFDQYLPVIDRHASDYGAFAHNGMAEAAMFTGDVERALSEYATVERIGRSTGQSFAIAAGLAGQVRVAALCGMDEHVERDRAEAVEIAGRPGGDFLRTSVLADVGYARLHGGNVEGAREDLARGLTVSSVTARWERPRVLFGLARVALAQSQSPLAQEHLEEARSHVTTHGLRLYEPDLFLLDGIAAVADDRLADARTLLDEAVRSSGEIGRRPMKAEALVALARVHERGGEPEQADAARSRARTVMDEMANEIVADDLRESFVRSMQEVHGVHPLVP